MAYFEIEGGRQLSGSIFPQGAKNEALQVLCATLLTDEPVTIQNVPSILDIQKLIELLEGLGVEVDNPKECVFTFQSRVLSPDYLKTEEFREKSGRLRGAVMLAGPMLARCGKMYLPQPGGDKIGRRRLDTHILGFQKLGADCHYDAYARAFYLATTGDRLQGNYILLDEPSVTGTANILMAAVLAKGTTTIYNAACEPYVQQLCRMLNSMGAHIVGLGSNMLTIEGVDRLHGCVHTLMSDFIEIGSFIALAAMTQSELTIKNAHPKELGVIPNVFERLGVQIICEGEDLRIPKQEVYEIGTFLEGSIMTIADHPWPGVSPDLLSVILVMATQARGNLLIHQKMFESRLFFVDKLIDMGAQIVLCDPHRAVVMGLGRRARLRGIRMISPDIRAGVAMLIAALSADGKSIIENIGQIDRGYQQIDTRLNALGASITRVEL